MSAKNPVADPDIEREYDFRDSVPNPYAERCWQSHALLATRCGGPSGSTTRPQTMLLVYDESAAAALDERHFRVFA